MNDELKKLIEYKQLKAKESNSFYDKCLDDYYMYFAFINQIGWIKFTEAQKTTSGKYKLKEVEFLLPIRCIESDWIINSAKDHERGLEVAEENIICIVDHIS